MRADTPKTNHLTMHHEQVLRPQWATEICSGLEKLWKQLKGPSRYSVFNHDSVHLNVNILQHICKFHWFPVLPSPHPITCEATLECEIYDQRRVVAGWWLGMILCRAHSVEQKGWDCDWGRRAIMRIVEDVGRECSATRRCVAWLPSSLEHAWGKTKSLHTEPQWVGHRKSFLPTKTALFSLLDSHKQGLHVILLKCLKDRNPRKRQVYDGSWVKMFQSYFSCGLQYELPPHKIMYCKKSPFQQLLRYRNMPSWPAANICRVSDIQTTWIFNCNFLCFVEFSLLI